LNFAKAIEIKTRR